MSRLNEIQSELEELIERFGELHARYQHLQMLGQQLQDPQVAETVMRPVKCGMVFPEPIGMVEMATTGGEALAQTAVSNAANNIVRAYPGIFQEITQLAGEASQHCMQAIQLAEQQQAVQPSPVSPAPQVTQAPQVRPLQDQAPPPPQQIVTTPVTPVQ